VVNFPDNEYYEDNKVKKIHDTFICFAYEKDLVQIYGFYCARYKDMKYSEFLDLGINEVLMKIDSIPETEPLFNIIKSRVINLKEIKDKEERKYWRKMKQQNKIPDIYLPNEELDRKAEQKLGGIKNGKKFI
jgi:hypothetical protein